MLEQLRRTNKKADEGGFEFVLVPPRNGIMNGMNNPSFSASNSKPALCVGFLFAKCARQTCLSGGAAQIKMPTKEVLSYLSPPFGITREGCNPRSKFQKTNSKLQKNFKKQIPKSKHAPNLKVQANRSIVNRQSFPPPHINLHSSILFFLAEENIYLIFPSPR